MEKGSEPTERKTHVIRSKPGVGRVVVNYADRKGHKGEEEWGSEGALTHHQQHAASGAELSLFGEGKACAGHKML